MSKAWIVEGTYCVTFRTAMIAAQLLADANRAMVPLLKECDGEVSVVRMVEPR